LKTSTVERRGTPRRPLHGPVRLRPAATIAAPFVGEMIDLSACGFRAAHPCLTLSPGSRVEFEFNGRSGSARTIWTRIEGERAETGFSILGG